jgi:hypothetical protein
VYIFGGCSDKAPKLIRIALMFWLASAIPISQIPVFPPNPRLAKLSIAAIEPIGDVA